jgi:hypothetical protein
MSQYRDGYGDGLCDALLDVVKRLRVDGLVALADEIDQGIDAWVERRMIALANHFDQCDQ